MAAPLTNYLRTHRKRLNLSQRQVAMLLGLVSGTTVTRHESAERVPELQTAIAYAVILGASIEELFAGMVVEVESFIRSNARTLESLRETDERADHSPDFLAVLSRLAKSTLDEHALDSCSTTHAQPNPPCPLD